VALGVSVFITNQYCDCDCHCHDQPMGCTTVECSR
jgi:hypothetical protein